jgi:CO/xanthine dehydrogenase FAD-binding subunit
MDYFCPQTLEEAFSLLANDPDARCLAGGATLMAMMNAELLSPTTLVSLRSIDALKGIVASSEGFRIGAMTRHHEVANYAALDGGFEVVRLAAGEIGHPAIRAVGTIGGSIAHADPAADYPTALVAADAEIELSNSAGQRRIAASDFFEDFFTTALQAGEIVTAVHLKSQPLMNVSAYTKIARCDGDFATASLAFCGSFDNRTCASARVAVGGCAATPIHVPAVDAMLVGSELGSETINDAAAALADACDPIDDVRGTADYRRLLVKRLLPPLLERACASRAG